TSRSGSYTRPVTRRPTRFAAVDRPKSWPRLRGGPRPERLDASLETLKGVGPQIQRKLAKLGLETVGDLLQHRPFRYEAAVPARPPARATRALRVRRPHLRPERRRGHRRLRARLPVE